MTKTTPQSVLNSFTVTVSAAEVKKNKASGASTQGEEASGKAQPKIYATASTSYGSAWSGDESGKKASYWILAPISCTGDNIKSVTYTINKGYFTVAAKKDSKYLIASESKLRKKPENKFGVALEFSDSEDPEADSLYDQNEYTSFTVSGTEKPEKKFCIAFVGEGNLTKKGYSALFENVGKNLQEDLKARQQLIGDTVITCTAIYKDGSQKSVDIKVGTEILTGKEAGIDTTAEGKDEVTEDMAAKKDVYTTFEVQQ